VIGETLQDLGIAGALNMKQIVQDFKLPDIPEGQDLGKTLNNVAFGRRNLISGFFRIVLTRGF
jgi:hypothetical protein